MCARTRQRTRIPLLTRRCTRWPPMKPRQPVTSTVSIDCPDAKPDRRNRGTYKVRACENASPTNPCKYLLSEFAAGVYVCTLWWYSRMLQVHIKCLPHYI